MQRKFNISVDGRSYTVVVEELSADGSSPPVPAAAPAVAAQAVASPAAVASVSAPAPAPVAASSAQDILAPLAGVIDSIDVRVGQTVKAGDKVAVVEAMKMKTDVFTKVAGTVQRIAVKAHDSVDTDQVILTIG